MLVINVHADTILFRPRIGNRLRFSRPSSLFFYSLFPVFLEGVVRHLSLDGIVVAVLGVFLGVIRSEDIASLMAFNPEVSSRSHPEEPVMCDR